MSQATQATQEPLEWDERASLQLVQRTKAPTLRHRLVAVGLAIAQIDIFVVVDRPCIVEAFELLAAKKGVFRIAMDHMTRHPTDREIGRAFQVVQEMLHGRSMELAGSPDATHVMMSRPGPPIARLVRLVIAPLYWNGYDWSVIADLVVDNGSRLGREVRLRKLHESDPILPIRKLLENSIRSREASGEV